MKKTGTINYETLAAALASRNIDVRFAVNEAYGSIAEALYWDMEFEMRLGVISAESSFIDAHPCNDRESYKNYRLANSLLQAIKAIARASSESGRAGLGRILTEFVNGNDRQQSRRVLYDFAAFFGGPESFLAQFWEHTETFLNEKYRYLPRAI